MARNKKSNAGRPTVVTPEVVGKLEYAFALGCTDLEACFYAGICKDALYGYQARNPEFTERKQALKERPIFIARESVLKGMKEDHNLALKFLERKKKDEFSLRQEVQVEVDDDKTDEELDARIKALIDKTERKE